jgi:hypothetical protein
VCVGGGGVGKYQKLAAIPSIYKACIKLSGNWYSSRETEIQRGKLNQMPLKHTNIFSTQAQHFFSTCNSPQQLDHMA